MAVVSLLDAVVSVDTALLTWLARLEATIIVRIFRDYAAGRSARQIARRVESQRGQGR